MFESLAKQLRGGVPDRLASVLDTDLRDTRRAMEVSLPALIGGLRDKSLEPGGPGEILEILGGKAGAPVEDVDRYLTEHDPRLGASVLDQVFGARGQTALTSLSKASGLPTRLLAQVMSMLGPVVTGWLANKVGEEEFDETELRTFLQEEANDLDTAGYGKVLALVSGTSVVAAAATGAAATGAAAAPSAPAAPAADPGTPPRPRIVTVSDGEDGIDDDAYEDGISVPPPDPSTLVDSSAPLSAVPSAPAAPSASLGSLDEAIPGADMDYSPAALAGAPTVPSASPLPTTDYDAGIDYGGRSNMLMYGLGALALLGVLLLTLWACNRGGDTVDTDTAATTTEVTSQVEPQIDVQGSLTESLRPFEGVVGVLNGNTAVLTGNVADVGIKNAAQATAEQVTGVDSVQNNLVIGNGNTIVDRLGITPELVILNELVAQAGLAEVLSTQQSFTLFAPTDDAFNRLPPEELAALRADPTRLKTLLSYHLAVGDQFNAALLTERGGGTLSTAQGEGIFIAETPEGAVRINDVANILAADVVAENGLIHIIDGVLIPAELGGPGATGAAPEPVPEELGEALSLGSITFASGSSDITDAGKSELDKVVNYLVENPIAVEVAGHTDTSGPAEGNQTLSEQRASAVRDYLIGQGVDETLLTAVGYGETEPIAVPDDTTEAKEQNRRIEFNTGG